MAQKPTYEELEQRVKELEKEAVERNRVDENILLQSEVAKNLAEGVYLIRTSDGTIVYANKTFESMFGYDPGELIGKHVSLVNAPSRKRPEEIADNIIQCLKEKGSWSGEVENIKKDGTRFWCHANVSTFNHHNFGEVWVSIHDNITERKLLEKELKTHRNHLEKLVEERTSELKKEIEDRKRAEDELKDEATRRHILVDQSKDGIVVLDQNGKVFEANQRYAERLGYTMDEVLQLYVWDWDTQWTKDQLLEMIRTVDEIGNSVETRHRRKDGTHYDVEVSTNGAVCGGLKLVFCVHRDITERKRVEEALRRSEEKYRTLFEAESDAVFIVDEKTANILDANESACQLYGYSHEEITALKAIDLSAEPEKTMIKIQVPGKSFVPVRYHRKKDGTVFVVEIASNDFELNGRRTNVSAIRDITDRKQAEEEKRKLEAQLKKAQKMQAIGILAGGIAHNFNNLLMGIQGNISLMLLDMDISHAYYNRLKNIEKQIQSGAKLTSQLLGYASKGKYVVKPISLNPLVNEISITFGHTRREILIHKKLNKDLFVIEADHGQIEQVLLNLFVNAADAMPGGGNLFLETINVSHKDMKSKPYKPKAGNYVLLTVRDTGVGIDKSDIENIFEPFFTTKEMGRGTGLGLASVYGIIKAHGGYVEVESMKRQGTTFKLYLPASESKLSEDTKTSDKLIKGSGTVLLVDDEEIIQEVCKELLENIGYSVLTAQNGKEAIELYRNNQDNIDLVLLDMIMPNMSGGEVYDRMKEINPDMKVLLSSGYTIDGEATEILNRGCNGFIQKPFNLNELSRKISEILNKK